MSGGGSSTTDYEELSYDAASNVTDRRLRNGASIGYGYDRLNRLTGKTLPPGSGNPIPSYSYDLLGQMTSASNAHPTLPYSNGTSFTWDALGRKIGETSSYNGTNLIVKTMEYDLAGRQTKFSWPGELYVTYDYNDANDLKTIKENGSTMLFTFTYDDLGRRLTKDTLNNNNMVYAYDPASRLTYWQNNGGGTGTEVTLGGYSPAGEIGSRVSTNAAYAAAKPQDGTTSYTPNGLNQYGAISSTAPITVEYDLKQNMSKFGSKTASFGAENMITTGGPSSYWHDALNRITYLTQKGLRFDNEGSNLVGIYSGATLLRRYIYEPGATAPILWYEGTGSGADRRFMDADERGSIIRVSGSSGGTIRINSYDEYGVPGANNLGRFGYTGHIWLPEAGMYYARNRMYEPKLGRFMQTDPIGYDDGMNIYAYVRNDPVNAVDPFGLDIVVPGVKPKSDADTSACGPNVTGCASEFSPEDLKANEPVVDPNPIVVRGRRPQKADEKKKSTCDLVADQPGKVFVDFGSASFVAGLGGSGSVGVFKNLSTGSGGFFYTLGGNLGFEAGAGLSGGFYRSAADLRGLNANINVSAGVSGSANFSASGRLVGGSLGQSGRLGGSVSLSNTTFFGCNYNGG